MVQAINTRAILTLASIARRPSLLVPHIAVPNVSEINFESIQRDCNIRAVAFDKDNTLTDPYGKEIHENARVGLENAMRVFGKAKVAILSNSAGTLDDPSYEEAGRIEESLGIPVIRHTDKKPGCLEEVMEHFDLSDPSQVCMVGDRLMTDVVFGNLHGMLTIHTLPLCTGSDNAGDNWTAKLIRPVENAVLYRDWFGGRWLRNSRDAPDRYSSG